MSPETQNLEHKLKLSSVVNGLSGLMMATSPFLAPVVGIAIEKGLEMLGYIQIDHITDENGPVLGIAVLTYFFGSMVANTISEGMVETYRQRHLEALKEQVDV